ncbi:hypothetical protein PENTCL1PPCAC_21024, partial [Pristionchus entomophagus]
MRKVNSKGSGCKTVNDCMYNESVRGEEDGNYGLPDRSTSSSACEDERDNHSIESEYLKEDEDEDHADEQSWLLGRSSHSGVPHDADGIAGAQAAQPARQPCSQMRESFVEIVFTGARRLDLALEHHRDNETVHADDSGHDDRDDRFHDEFGPHHARRADTDRGLGSSVRGTEHREDLSGSDTHEPEERRVCRALCGFQVVRHLK